MKKIYKCLAFFILITLVCNADENKTADQNYIEGENAKTIEERSIAFNKALKGYYQMEQECCPEFGSGKLYFNLGDAHYQLENYPLALYYFYQAQTLRPRDLDVKQNLEITLKKMSLPKEKSSSFTKRLFLFKEILSTSERIQIFIGIAIFLGILLSIAIWTSYERIKWIVIFTVMIFTYMGSGLLYTKFFSPMKGLLIEPSYLFRDAGTQYASILEEPLFPGSKLEIIGIKENGRWFQVLTSENIIGYIPANKARILAQ